MNDSLASDRLESIFHQALDVSDAAERDRFLADACRGDAVLRASVERLLDSHGETDDCFLEHGFRGEVASWVAERPGERIGHYQLREQIGEGGFGVVWRAQQEQPMRRTVALKIIKLGMDTREVIARFEQERQALALMDHPGIAKVFDAGATPTGRPFFAMELVHGTRITEFCDHAALPMAGRLRLFVQVCHAVQHAHQKGIIHRDLKPSNILVTLLDGVPVPKVIDFGVAKATQQKLTELTLLTRVEQIVGTPLYLSPEQAALRGLDVDTRSDIYSLGVLLYELLTGRLPFDVQELMRGGIDEIRRVIREQEPPRPSTALSTMAREALAQCARHRSSEPPKLIGSVRGDLDWIVMRALEKDRERRYPTATAFAEDIERHLALQPVRARPPSNVYRFRRAVRRNQSAFIAAGAVAVALIAGIAASAWQAVRANAALAELRETAPSFAEQARGLAARERFDEAIQKLDYAAKLRPDAAEYLAAKGDLLQCQLRLREAAANYRAALKLNPGDTRMRDNAVRCKRLLAGNADPHQLSRESLGELYTAMQREQRPAAQLLLVATRLGEENAVLLRHWRERLQELPVPPERPMEQRLTIREDGLLALDLTGTKVSDLRPLEGMPLAELDCTGCRAVTSLAPLRGMPLRRLRMRGTGIDEILPLESLGSLEELDLAETKITNLQPLQKLPLKILELRKLPIFDISALRGVRLQELGISETRITDLAPLQGMPLRRLDADSIAAVNFTPLKGLPLEVCSLRSTRCYDLDFLRGMPLRELFLTGSLASNFPVLGELPSLEILALPDHFKTWSEETFAGISALRGHARLQMLGVEETRAGTQRLLTSAAHFWQERDREATVLQPLRSRGMTVTLNVLPDRTWELSLENQPLSSLEFLRGLPVSRLCLRNTKVIDLSPLAGLPLKALSIRSTEVADLRPLAGMPLEELEITRTRVTDLSPLAGMPLRSLEIEDTKISDLSPLRGMALREFWMGTTQVSDLSPLRGMPIRVTEMDECPNLLDLSPLLDVPTLEQIRLPKTAQNIELLRELKNVKYIAFSNAPGLNRPAQTWEQFWNTRTLAATEAALVREERWDELESLVRDRLRSRGAAEPWKDWLKLGAIALARSDHWRYQAVCAEMLHEMRDASSENTTRMLFFQGDVRVDSWVLRRHMELARRAGEKAGARPWAALACGMGEYRLGAWAQSEKVLQSAFPSPSADFYVMTRAVLAMALYQQGNVVAARAALTEARDALADKNELGRRLSVDWHDWLIARFLVQQAEDVLATKEKP